MIGVYIYFIISLNHEFILAHIMFPIQFHLKQKYCYLRKYLKLKILFIVFDDSP